MKQTTTQKAWIAGTNTTVVTIPKAITQLQKIEPGDFIKVTVEKISNETTKELTNEKNQQIIQKIRNVEISGDNEILRRSPLPTELSTQTKHCLSPETTKKRSDE